MTAPPTATPVEARIAVGDHLGPRTNQDEVSQDLSMFNGSLEVVTPLTLGLNLIYQPGMKPVAIVAVDTSHLSSGGVPGAIYAQFTCDSTAETNCRDSTFGLSPGSRVRFALKSNTSASSMGRYL